MKSHLHSAVRLLAALSIPFAAFFVLFTWYFTATTLACLGLAFIAIMLWLAFGHAKDMRIGKPWLFSVAGLLFFGGFGHLYLSHPHFGRTTPTRIEMRFWAPDESFNGSNYVLHASVTNAASCSSIMNLLRSGTRTAGHKCAEMGLVTIQYPNGKSNVLEFLPGHDPTRYEFRKNGGDYTLARNTFFSVLRDAGIDTARIPTNEH